MKNFSLRPKWVFCLLLLSFLTTHVVVVVGQANQTTGIPEAGGGGGGGDNVTLPIEPPPGDSINGTLSPTDGGNITTVPPSDDSNVTIPGANGTIPPVNIPGNGTLPPDVVATPQPTAVPSMSNTENQVYFTLEYGFDSSTPGAGAGNSTGGMQAPSQEEIEDLMCRTNLFFRDRIRNATQNETVQSVALYIDWDYVPELVQPVVVSFLSNSTFGYGGDFVPPEVVQEALQVTPQDIVLYIQDYIWTGSVQDSIFRNATNVNFNDQVGNPVPPGLLESATCPETEAPSAMPSVSPAPTTSSAPSLSPTASPAPTSSSRPSTAPSVSSAPTVSPTGGPPTTPIVSPNVTTAPNLNATNATTAPVPPPAPGPAPLPPGYVARETIRAEFLVTNLDGITDPSQVNSSGLAAGWNVFVEETVREISTERGYRQRQLQLQLQLQLLRQQYDAATELQNHIDNNRENIVPNHHQQRRRLAADLEPGSAFIESLYEEDCATAADGKEVSDDLICHNAIGVYNIMLTDGEEPTIVKDVYGKGTVARIENGRLQEVVREQDPSSPLYIGVPPNGGNDDDGMPVWLLVLIILLCILVCLCCLCALFYFLVLRNKDTGGKTEPYDEEGGFVYDFLIPPNQKPQTEVDDDVEEEDTKDAADDELFEDEDADNGADDEPVATIIEENEDDVDDTEKGDSDKEAESDDEAPVQVEPEDVKTSFSDSDPDMVPVSNDMEGSSSFNASGGGENWDDEKGGDDFEDGDNGGDSDGDDWKDEEKK